MTTNIKSCPSLIDGTWKTSSANTFKEREQAAINSYTRTKAIYVNHG